MDVASFKSNADELVERTRTPVLPDVTLEVIGVVVGRGQNANSSLV